jgi:branched-chain amino acid aminotransferase
MTSKHVWLNGKLVAADEAAISFFTAGLHYGVGVFEGIRCYATDRGPAVFRLRDHLDRLVDSARLLGFREVPYAAGELAEATRQVVRANGFDECYIRPLLYLADGGWNLSLDTGRPRVGIGVWKWDNFLGAEALDRGIRANVSSLTRHHPNVTMTKAKIAGNYANSVLAKTEALRLGFDEAIMLDPDGYVAQCTGENIFIVRRGELVTPPAAVVLEGITRETIMALARHGGLTVVEEMLSRDQLYLADEVFVCGTAAEVVALREIDFRPIGAGVTGPITRELQREFRAATRGRHALSPGWLDYVNVPSAVEAPSTTHVVVEARHEVLEIIGYGHGV